MSDMRNLFALLLSFEDFQALNTKNRSSLKVVTCRRISSAGVLLTKVSDLVPEKDWKIGF
jgi:hypothetical protein